MTDDESLALSAKMIWQGNQIWAARSKTVDVALVKLDVAEERGSRARLEMAWGSGRQDPPQGSRAAMWPGHLAPMGPQPPRRGLGCIHWTWNLPGARDCRSRHCPRLDAQPSVSPTPSGYFVGRPADL